MKFFHTCKVKTNEEAVIPNNLRYQQLVGKVAAADALTSVRAAHIMLDGESAVNSITRRQSLENFQIPMKRTMMGLYMIEVLVNHQKLQFVLDTGAQVSGICEHAARKLGLDSTSGKMRISSVGGQEKAMRGWIAGSLQVGALELFQYPMITIEKLKLPMIRMDGIIGWDILSTLDFEMDDISKLFIVMKNRYRFDYCNLIKGMFPIMILLDENSDMHLFGMDSGATVSWLNEASALEAKRKVVNEITAVGIGVHGAEQLNLKVFEGCEYRLFKAKIKITNINTGRTDVLPGLQLDGVLGNEIFRNRRIRFINSKGMVLLA